MTWRSLQHSSLPFLLYTCRSLTIRQSVFLRKTNYVSIWTYPTYKFTRLPSSVPISVMSRRRQLSTKSPQENSPESTDSQDHSHEHGHSHSHSIFGGHSHSHGEEGHNYGAEKIMAAWEGSGMRFVRPSCDILYTGVKATEVAKSRLLGSSPMSA